MRNRVMRDCSIDCQIIHNDKDKRKQPGFTQIVGESIKEAITFALELIMHSFGRIKCSKYALKRNCPSLSELYTFQAEAWHLVCNQK